MWSQKGGYLLRTVKIRETIKKIQCRYVSSPYNAASAFFRSIHAGKQVVVKEKVSGGRRRRLEIQPSPYVMSSQSIILPGPEKVRASAMTSTPEILVDCPNPETQTVYDVLMIGSSKNRTGKCLGTRTLSKHPEYEWMSYAEVVERSGYIGSGLVNLGIEASQKSFVGICTKTRTEFVLTMLGTSRSSMVLVPMYECLPIDIVSFIMNQADMKVIICENLRIALNIIKNIDKYPLLKHLVLIEDTEEIDQLKTTDVNVISFTELQELGKSNMHKPKKTKPDDLFCICYTSGTTGQPKGVMVSHRNVLSSITAMDTVFGDAIPKNGTLFAYLPCAHIYEIVNEIYCLYQGGQAGFFSGDTENLLSDIKYLKPTVLPLVPKLMNRIYSAVKNKVGPNILKRYMLKLALHQKEKYLKRGIVSNNTIWDYLVFSQIQQQLGGNVNMMFTASAPVSKEVMRFFRCASGCLVFEAYGLSEVGAATMTLMSEHDSGFVGPPLPSNHIKLVSVPDLFYNSEDDVGEICIRGPNVFCGYYKNAEDTNAALDKDGWHYTGDIGKWLPNGALAIIDRKKHIFKLSQGEYIVPEKSENVYVQSHLLSQVFVDGQMEQDYAVAIVVPDEPVFLKWAKEKGFKDLSYQQLCENDNIRRAVLEHMLRTGKRKNLSSLQQVGNIYLTTEAFTQENGLLTPTLKLKRPEARKKFENAIQALYNEGNMRKQLNV